MKIVFLFPEKLRPRELEAPEALYFKRLKSMGPFESLHYKEERIDNRQPNEVKASEAKRIQKHLKDDDYVVACDEHGEQLSTEKLKDLLNSGLNAEGPFSGKKRLVFIIGGALGLDQSILKRANKKIALSKLTLAGALARVILLEAVYRAMTIVQGHPYHNS